MLDQEYIERVEMEMAESGGTMAPDDHETVWEQLRYFSDLADELAFAISLLTDRSLAYMRQVARREAVHRNPGLPLRDALSRELCRHEDGI